MKFGKLYTKMINKLRLISRKDSIVSNGVNFAYALFGQGYVQTIITIIFPFIISYYLNKVTSDNNAAIEASTSGLQVANIANNNYQVALIIWILVYLILEIFILMINHHRQSKMRDVKWFQSALGSHASVNAFIANSLYKFTKRFINFGKNSDHIIPLDIAKDIVGFQEFAFAVCKDIYKIIKDLCACDRPQVTVVQKFVENGNKYIRMVAYETYNGVIPSSYSERYFLANSSLRFDEKIFCSKETNIRVLSNKKAIEDNFEISDYSKEREEAICQYIGVPIKDSSGEIVFLLQVDVNKENVLGKSELALKELAQNVLLPYTQLLYAIYEHERMLETLHTNITINKYYEKRIQNEKTFIRRLKGNIRAKGTRVFVKEKGTMRLKHELPLVSISGYSLDANAIRNKSDNVSETYGKIKHQLQKLYI